MQDTFRGRVCECPVEKGVRFTGDGYTHCAGICFYIFPKRVPCDSLDHPNSGTSLLIFVSSMPIAICSNYFLWNITHAMAIYSPHNCWRLTFYICLYFFTWHGFLILVAVAASGALRCEIHNGGCWKDTKGGRTYSACVVSFPIVPSLFLFFFNDFSLEIVFSSMWWKAIYFIDKF